MSKTSQDLIEQSAQTIDAYRHDSCDDCEPCQLLSLIGAMRQQIVHDLTLRERIKRDLETISKEYADYGDKYDERGDSLGAEWCNAKAEAFATVLARLRSEDGKPADAGDHDSPELREAVQNAVACPDDILRNQTIGRGDRTAGESDPDERTGGETQE